MARFLVTRVETYAVEADDAREAEAVAEDLRALGIAADTEDFSVEILKGITG